MKYFNLGKDKAATADRQSFGEACVAYERIEKRMPK